MKPVPLQIRVARAGELSPAPSSPGIERSKVFETDRALMIQTRVAGNTASGWHHHGDRDVYAHLIQGRARFEFGPGGQESVEIKAGEFFYVPATLVHRDVNPTPEEQLAVLVFVGGGPLVVNVDGPEQAPSTLEGLAFMLYFEEGNVLQDSQGPCYNTPYDKVTDSQSHYQIV